MEYGLQMFSVRDLTEDDLAGALKKVAQLGYRLIEFAGFFGHSADEINAMLKENGLKLSATHSELSELSDDYESTIAFHKAIGNKHYIIPHYDFSTKVKVDEFIDEVNRLQPLLEKEDIELSFHNHDREFKPNLDGVVPFNELVNRTKLIFELDTYWVYAAGADPVEWMEKLKNRMNFIHIKDGMPDGKGMPLGQGSAPVKAVYIKAKELKVPMVVESETLTPDGLTEAKICIEFLKLMEV